MRHALILLAALLTLCCRTMPAAAEIAIGIANPLSGPFAASGARNLLAAMSAVEHLNENGGVLGEPVRLVSVDDECGTAEAVDAAERLVRAGVVVVVGHMCSHSSLMAAAIYDIAGIVMISPDSTHPRLTEEGRPNVFRLIGRDDRQAIESAKLIASRWPQHRIAVVHDGSLYGHGLALQTRHALRRRKIEIALLEPYEPHQPDYSSLIERLRDAKIELLFVGGYGPDAGRIAADARETGLNLQLIGGDGLGMDEFWSTAGEAGAGTIFSTFRLPRDEAPAKAGSGKLPSDEAPAKAGSGKLPSDEAPAKAGSGKLPSDEAPAKAGSELRQTVLSRFAAGGLGTYAAIEVWAEAATRARTLEAKSVIRVLQYDRFDTVRGDVAFDDKGDLRNAAWAWQVWQRGRKVPLD